MLPFCWKEGKELRTLKSSREITLLKPQRRRVCEGSSLIRNDFNLYRIYLYRNEFVSKRPRSVVSIQKSIRYKLKSFRDIIKVDSIHVKVDSIQLNLYVLICLMVRPAQKLQFLVSKWRYFQAPIVMKTLSTRASFERLDNLRAFWVWYLLR